MSFPQVIPPETPKHSRTLVLCFDGTGDQYGQDNSNIVQFIQLLKKDNFDKQMVYYQAGIGTSCKHFITPIGVAISKAADMALAHGLQNHVTDGYEFLMQNYRDGDKVRAPHLTYTGAHGHWPVGLLPRANHQQVPFAYHMYQRDDEEGWEMSNGFKQAFSIDVEIHFMGLFDTVNSVGLIPRELPFAKSNYVVRYFRHAVALDERRSKFKDNLWGRTSDRDAALAAPPREDYVSNKRRKRMRKKNSETTQPTLLDYGTAVAETINEVVETVSDTIGGFTTAIQVVKMCGSTVLNALGGHFITHADYMNSRRYRTAKGSGIFLPLQANSTLVRQTGKMRYPSHCSSNRGENSVAHAIGGKRIPRAETDVEEVWFAGSHTDVGGGSVKNGERYSLARISLRWIIRQCFKCNTGIMFHSNLLEDVGLSPETLWPAVLPRPPPITSSDQIPSHEYYDSRNTHYSLELDTVSKLGSCQRKNLVSPGRPTRHNAQLSAGVNPCEPYIPVHWRIGHELRDFGQDAWERREPFINEEVEDFKDALSPIHDQLSLNWWWWILEFIPIKQVWRKKERGWRRVFGINFGGARVITGQKRTGVNVHRTVKIRMEAETDLARNPFSYSPRAVLKKHWIEWLDGSEKRIS
ncbi:hypothetical protein RSOLAG22IIIB_07453 [Rhizoctonia solani]|uniref:T6SS Phospholipase effector Tle1-like catalytic domain-containing protein n=1 Tax=Rhizoctonia solani TaxID=456999 RepID=A0A0K6FNM3_9AGAM|nr:hypothetical protein RSOLAG22IIIB_07453 [Rhizoctonia solani]